MKKLYIPILTIMGTIASWQSWNLSYRDASPRLVGRPPPNNSVTALRGPPLLTEESGLSGIGIAETMVAKAAAPNKMDRKESIVLKRMWVGVMWVKCRGERNCKSDEGCRVKKRKREQGALVYIPLHL